MSPATGQCCKRVAPVICFETAVRKLGIFEIMPTFVELLLPLASRHVRAAHVAWR